jgi:hypothetical protein
MFPVMSLQSQHVYETNFIRKGNRCEYLKENRFLECLLAFPTNYFQHYLVSFSSSYCLFEFPAVLLIFFAQTLFSFFFPSLIRLIAHTRKRNNPSYFPQFCSFESLRFLSFSILPSTEIKRRIVCMWTGVSEEHIISIFRVGNQLSHLI